MASLCDTPVKRPATATRRRRGSQAANAGPGVPKGKEGNQRKGKTHKTKSKQTFGKKKKEMALLA